MINNLIEYVSVEWRYILSLLYNHIQYSFIAVFIAILIGVPLGIIIYNSKALNKPVLSFTNIVQAIPSLAALGFIVPYFGIGASTAIFMVVIYSLLPIVKNTCAGLSSIDKNTLEAAKGIGMKESQILFIVQIPLALPVIMAGIRISSVTSVGLMTIAAYIGADVLGTLVISGIQMDNTSMIFAGAIPACILALTMDFFMGKVEKSITPTSLQLKPSQLTAEKVASFRRKRKLTIITTSSIVLMMGIIFIANSYSSEVDIMIGSKESVEGRIVGHIMEEIIERKTNLKVDTKVGLGGTMIAYNALKTRDIDIYPDYTGTLLTAILKYKFEAGSSTDDIYDIINIELKKKDNIELLKQYPANNTYVLALRRETSEKFNLKKISDLKDVSSRLILGATPEFAVREDGLLGLEKTYNLDFKDVLDFSGTLRYTAIDSKDVDIITAFATDSLINKYNLITLEDDLNFFPPYNMVPVLTTEMVRTYPEAIEALNSIAKYLDDETMRRLNGYATDDGKSPSEIAKEFVDSIIY